MNRASGSASASRPARPMETTDFITMCNCPRRPAEMNSGTGTWFTTRAGDVILQVDRRPIGNAAELRSALADGRGPALVVIIRGGRTFYATVPR